MILKAIDLPERKVVFDRYSSIDRRIYLHTVAMFMGIDGNYGHELRKMVIICQSYSGCLVG